MIGNRERSIARRRALTTLAIVIIVFVLGWIPLVRTKILTWSEPLLARMQLVTSSIQQRNAKKQDREALDAEVNRLQLLLTHLIVEKTEYERLKIENVALRQLVKYAAPEKFQNTTCGIIAFDVASERKLMTLDCGTSHGITRGNAVLSPDGLLVGTIFSATEKHSIVQLLKDPYSRVAAEVTGVDDAQGIAMAVGGGAVALRFLGENVKINPATIIQTSGLLDQVPVGIPLGIVDTLAKESDTPFQRAIIQTPIDPATLNLVNVLISI